MKDNVESIELSGYNPETFLTGEFARRISTKLHLDEQRKNGEISKEEYIQQLNRDRAINPLSVSNIADKYCPTRRDLYFYKGVNRLDAADLPEIWGGKVGYIVEEYVKRIFRNGINNNTDIYTSLIDRGKNLHNRFIEEKRESLERLRSLEESSSDIEKGDTDWLLTLLSNNGRAELGTKILHSLLREGTSLDITDIKIKEEIRPHITQIGINSPATPDFIIPEFGIVGDIKTGVKFEPHFQLTCAGYALAYENEKGSQKDINWGMIYFFPTRNPSAYVKPITFTQIYIFPIDDDLRQWFLDIRDEAYKIISKVPPPVFPEVHKRKQCRYCSRFKDYCMSQGLELSDHE